MERLEDHAIAERHLDRAWKTFLDGSRSVRTRLLVELRCLEYSDDSHGSLVRVDISVPGFMGETDVYAEWRSAAGAKLVVLIEDKLTASFQPRQGQRYANRAKKLRDDGAEVRTLLVARRAYLRAANSEAQFFDCHLDLETVLDWMDEAALEVDSVTLAVDPTTVSILREALKRIAASLPLGAKGLHANLHSAIADECAKRCNGLRVRNRPTDYIFLEHPRRCVGMEVRYRIDKQITELGFTPAFTGDLTATLATIPLAWRIVDSGKTRYVRNALPVVSAYARLGEPTPADVTAIVDSLEQLLSWWTSTAEEAALRKGRKA